MKVLIAIDMLRDFIEEKGPLFCGEECREILPFIRQRIDECRESGCKVIYICDSHAPDDREFGLFSAHAVKGSEGAKIIDELKPEDEDIVIEKTTVDVFYNTDLEKVLRDIAPDEVYVTGVCTSICVLEAVSGLSVRGYKTLVFRDGVADFDNVAHEFALMHMKKTYGAQIV